MAIHNPPIIPNLASSALRSYRKFKNPRIPSTDYTAPNTSCGKTATNLHNFTHN